MTVSNKKRILVIGAGWEQYALIKTIKEQGHYIIATHPKLAAEGFKLADTFYVKDSRDIGAHISIAQAHEIDAVVTDNCDYSFYTASIVASKLGLPFADIQSAIYSNDKYLQRQACKKSGIHQPEFYEVRNMDELLSASHQLQYPVILKPVDSRGTFGVTIINTDEELRSAFYNAVDNSPSRVLICEKFIEGILITVDGFYFRNGHRALAVASRKFESGAKPVTKEIIYPADIPEATRLKLLLNHDAVAKALNYRYGHTHGEYILTGSNEIFLVECTNRGGGVYTSSVILPLLTDLDINLSLLNQSLGIDELEATGEPMSFMKKAVILTFLDFEVGAVVKSINLQQMRDQPYSVRFRTIYGENDMVESIENCASRHSMLVLKGDTIDNVKENLSQFKATLNIEYYR